MLRKMTLGSLGLILGLGLLTGCGQSYEGDYQGNLSMSGSVQAAGKTVPLNQTMPGMSVKVSKSGDGFQIVTPQCTLEATEDKASKSLMIKEDQSCPVKAAGKTMQVATSGSAKIADGKIDLTIEGAISGEATGTVKWGFKGNKKE